MEDRIKKAFKDVKVIRPYVQKGCYDLLRSEPLDGTPLTVKDFFWGVFVEPGMSIEMRMWSKKPCERITGKALGHQKWTKGVRERDPWGLQQQHTADSGYSKSTQKQKPPAPKRAPLPLVAESSPSQPKGPRPSQKNNPRRNKHVQAQNSTRTASNTARPETSDSDGQTRKAYRPPRVNSLEQSQAKTHLRFLRFLRCDIVYREGRFTCQKIQENWTRTSIEHVRCPEARARHTCDRPRLFFLVTDALQDEI